MSYSDAIVAPRETMSYLEDAVGAWFRLKLEDSRKVSPTSCAVPKSMQITVPEASSTKLAGLMSPCARPAHAKAWTVQSPQSTFRARMSRGETTSEGGGGGGRVRVASAKDMGNAQEQSHLVARHFDAVNHTHDGWARSCMNAVQDVMLTAQ